ncbi:MAG: SPFH domain-containing protein, partial [Chloroflexota bacterium]
MSMNNNNSPYRDELEQLSDFLGNLNQFFSGRGGTFYIIPVVIVLLIWLASGAYIVQPGEEGVVQTFGRFSSVSTPGLNYYFPWPFQQVTIVDVESIRRVE